jgi:hypothetical protein
MLDRLISELLLATLKAATGVLNHITTATFAIAGTSSSTTAILSVPKVPLGVEALTGCSN